MTVCFCFWGIYMQGFDELMTLSTFSVALTGRLGMKG
jgi:hypothetical protein